MRVTMCAGVVALLVSAGCATQPNNDATTQRIAQLEAKVATVEKKNQDLTLKARIISNQLFDSPLDRFFASGEFWENTYDSGQADCAARCTANLQQEYAACATSANPTQCRTDALTRASNCQTQCSRQFPPPIP